MPNFTAQTRHPKHWPIRIGLGAIWCAAHLPFWSLPAIGGTLGRLLHALMRRRRGIALTNVGLCFPDRDATWRAALVRAHFHSLGISLLETAKAWFIPVARYRHRGHVHGLNHLNEATQAGKGVILLAGHFSTLEIAPKFLTPDADISLLYRPHKNPVFENSLRRLRLRYAAAVLRRRDLRQAARCLRAGGILWYAPDQDFGPTHSVFSHFFGVACATTTATARLARLGRAVVIPLHHERRDGGYEIWLDPPLGDFPSGNEQLDCDRLNVLIESWVRRTPADYLWLHRRFKTRPEGEAALYDPVRVSEPARPAPEKS